MHFATNYALGAPTRSIVICVLQRVISSCAILIVVACGENEEWYCRTEGESMYSVSASGELGSAKNGCSCEQIRSFELRTFGEVDEEALKNDFGC